MLTQSQILKAKHLNDLRIILQPYLLFRAAINFKKGKSIHLYGHEHNCTYKQVTSGFSKSIVLDAEKGYTDLINYIEKKAAAGFIKTAKIYGRTLADAPFNTLHRVWYNNDWEDINDPAISPEQKLRNIPFNITGGFINIVDTSLPDFKEEVSKHLNKK